MSRDLGPHQRHLIGLAGKWRGEPVGYVAEHLGVSERRARKVVASLVERGLVVVVNDQYTGQRRIWTPEGHAEWVRAQRRADTDRESALLHPPKRAGRETGAAR